MTTPFPQNPRSVGTGRKSPHSGRRNTRGLPMRLWVGDRFLSDLGPFPIRFVSGAYSGVFSSVFWLYPMHIHHPIRICVYRVRIVYVSVIYIMLSARSVASDTVSIRIPHVSCLYSNVYFGRWNFDTCVYVCIPRTCRIRREYTYLMY